MFELDLSILKMYREVKFLGQSFQKLEPKQDKQTYRQTDATESIMIRRFSAII